MLRIDKTLIVLTKQDAEGIASTVARADKVEALRLLKELLAKKIELALRKRCK
jgi:hypothetical protein